MGLFTFIAIIVCLCVTNTSALCYGGRSDNVEGVYGQDTTLGCRGTSECNTIPWVNTTKGAFVPLTDTGHTFVERQGARSVLHIRRLTLEDTGSYLCWCYNSGGTIHGDSPICSITLTTICEAKVMMYGVTFIYNSSGSSPAAQYVLNVTENNFVRIECHEDAILETGCDPQNGGKKHMGDITASSSCNVLCTLRSESRKTSCNVNIFIEVQKVTVVHEYTTVTVPTTFASNLVAARNPLSILIPLITVVCVLLVIAIALCVYIFSPKLNKRSRSKGKSNPVYPSYKADLSPTYAMVDSNTDANIPVGPASIELGDAVPDNSYTYVNTANNRNVSDQQDIKSVESSDLYSQVTKPDNSGQTNGHPAIKPSLSATQEVYSEVNKRDRVAENDFETVSEEKENSTGFKKVTDIQNDNQVTEQPDLSSSDRQILDYEDMDTDTDGNEFAGLYAVVDKTKNKSQQK